MKTDVEPNIISYNIVIKACAEALDVASTEHWLSDLMKTDVEPNTISYNIVIKACAEALNVASAGTGCLS